LRQRVQAARQVCASLASAHERREQAAGQQIDPRGDVYAAGLVLYEQLAGRPAFTGDSTVTIALKQVRDTPVPPSTIDPSVPAALDAAILRCLESDPGLRFESMAELDAALAVVAGEKPPATAAGRWRLALIVLTAIFVLLNLALAWLALVHSAR
jgi:serine/threonine-protein kinase